VRLIATYSKTEARSDVLVKSSKDVSGTGVDVWGEGGAARCRTYGTKGERGET